MFMTFLESNCVSVFTAQEYVESLEGNEGLADRLALSCNTQRDEVQQSSACL